MLLWRGGRMKRNETRCEVLEILRGISGRWKYLTACTRDAREREDRVVVFTIHIGRVPPSQVLSTLSLHLPSLRPPPELVPEREPSLPSPSPCSPFRKRVLRPLSNTSPRSPLAGGDCHNPRTAKPTGLILAPTGTLHYR